MVETKKVKRERDWYSVSVSSVQRLFTVIGLVLLAGVGFVIYQRLGLDSLESRAERMIGEATARIQEVERREDIDQIRKDHKPAWDMHFEALQAFEERNFERALESAERCLIVLGAIERLGEGSIRVLSSQGSVEYRRGERGAWKSLRNHVTLNPGDWVKTSTNGSAELLFADGTLFTLRQSTMVHLGGQLGGGVGEDKATDITFGRVELNTSDKDRTVSTPRSEARVRRDSEALVSFDRDRGAGRFAAFTGGIQVTSKASGEKRDVGALQQVEQLGERLSEISSLPGKPELTGPGDDYAIDLTSDKEVTLTWKPVRNARRYNLRVSNSRLFAANFIEDTRAKSSARIGVRREGQFYWQVAALDAQGQVGPWSDTRSFRAASTSSIGEVSDKEPPPLEVASTETYGNIVIVNGRTEAGASVTINDEAVQLKSDGSFRSTLQMTKPGWNVIEIVSTDAWNNSSNERVRVFIDAI